MYIHAYGYIYEQIYIYIYIYTAVCMYVCACVLTHLYIYMCFDLRYSNCLSLMIAERIFCLYKLE